MFEGLTVLRRISIWFSRKFAGFHAANRAVTRWLLYCTGACMKCFSVFCSECSRARPSTGRLGHRQRVYVAVFMTCVADQLFALNRGCGLGLSHAVHWCVTHHRQAVCSEL